MNGKGQKTFVRARETWTKIQKTRNVDVTQENVFGRKSKSKMQ